MIETDHKALAFVNTAKHCNGRLARWAMKLQPYDFTIRYCQGVENGNADAFSRLVADVQDSCTDDLRSFEGGGGGGGEMLGDKTSPNMEIPRQSPKELKEKHMIPL